MRKKFLSNVSIWYDNYDAAECVKLDVSKFAVEPHSVLDELDKRLPSITYPVFLPFIFPPRSLQY
jgi:hypothetical protein